jgi:hypothetical protein
MRSTISVSLEEREILVDPRTGLSLDTFRMPGPAHDAFRRVTFVLRGDIAGHRVQSTQRNSIERVSLSPSDLELVVPATDARASSLHSLHHAGKLGDGMRAQKQVHVGAHGTELDQRAMLL